MYFFPLPRADGASSPRRIVRGELFFSADNIAYPAGACTGEPAREYRNRTKTVRNFFSPWHVFIVFSIRNSRVWTEYWLENIKYWAFPFATNFHWTWMYVLKFSKLKLFYFKPLLLLVTAQLENNILDVFINYCWFIEVLPYMWGWFCSLTATFKYYCSIVLSVEKYYSSNKYFS